VFQSAPIPQDLEDIEPRQGTSGIDKKMATEGKQVEKYKSTEKAMMMGPDGKLIPFVTLGRMSKEKEGKEESKKSPDPLKYKCIL